MGADRSFHILWCHEPNHLIPEPRSTGSMKAAILRDGAMVVDEIADLVPGPGQVLVETVACGICGSDLHTVDHADHMVETALDAGSETFDFDPSRDLVMGHELSVKVLETGPGVDGVEPDSFAAAMPMLTTPAGIVVPGYSNSYPGGYCQQMLLDPMALVPIPNGLAPPLAALTEPMAVGLHAVNQSSVSDGRAAVVIGAGPVGLAIIAALALTEAEPIIAADFSPTRRAQARALGAHLVIDPGQADDRQAGFALAMEAWAQSTGAGQPTPPVIFEAVGVPGMIDMAMTGAPRGSEIVVAGVCLEHDGFRPTMGIFKHLTLKFVLGWSPEEFVASLHNLAEGRIDGQALVTGEVSLDEVPATFAELATPDEHVKVLVRPNGR
jgi:threonine dehydrogenase-like Zn-dependent dehydrogenase